LLPVVLPWRWPPCRRVLQTTRSFVLIDKHKALDEALEAAIREKGRVEALRQKFDDSLAHAAHQAEKSALIDLIEAVPTTLAGVIASMSYIAGLADSRLGTNRGRGDRAAARQPRRSAGRLGGDLMSRNRAKRSTPRSAQIIRLPHEDFSFKAYDFPRSWLSERHDADRVMVTIVESILRMDAKALKRKVHLIPNAIEGPTVNDLIHDIKVVAGSFEGLAELFMCAAARLTVIDAKLV
jgi:hypothetical protein